MTEAMTIGRLAKVTAIPQLRSAFTRARGFFALQADRRSGPEPSDAAATKGIGTPPPMISGVPRESGPTAAHAEEGIRVSHL